MKYRSNVDMRRSVLRHSFRNTENKKLEQILNFSINNFFINLTYFSTFN